MLDLKKWKTKDQKQKETMRISFRQLKNTRKYDYFIQKFTVNILKQKCKEEDVPLSTYFKNEKTLEINKAAIKFMKETFPGFSLFESVEEGMFEEWEDYDDNESEDEFEITPETQTSQISINLNESSELMQDSPNTSQSDDETNYMEDLSGDLTLEDLSIASGIDKASINNSSGIDKSDRHEGLSDTLDNGEGLSGISDIWEGLSGPSGLTPTKSTNLDQITPPKNHSTDSIATETAMFSIEDDEQFSTPGKLNPNNSEKPDEIDKDSPDFSLDYDDLLLDNAATKFI